ncbi:MAG: UDP-N-acetylmuramoyl-L-alanyl-D-glutamate--2,6-diaminopimelate ligase [Cocleimonas sp.]|nr:UDP-N-acetylmuramoyl-L-alanyl-D-glutamate--2,6-diaminopimelate ligase [Cocleimonas sp.]
MAQSLRYLLEKTQGLDADALANISIDLLINGLTLDSRAVKKGMLFVAVKGTQVHGLHYALKAQQRGAVAILWASDEALKECSVLFEPITIPAIEVNHLAAQLGQIAQRYYQLEKGSQHPRKSHNAKLIGVTGTDGKTTVTHFFAQAMNALKTHKTAVMGTLGIGFPHDLQLATHTTPDVITVHKTACQLVHAGADFIAMEVSSHALDQQRVNGVDFEVAVLTNLTRDHLDYHGSVEKYAAAKARLFLRPDVKSVVLNAEDEFSHQIIRQLIEGGNDKTILRYLVASNNSVVDAELVARNAQFTHQGIAAEVSFGEQHGQLDVAVLGQFNLSNILATLAAMLALDVPFYDAMNALNKIKTVAGRMEKIEAPTSLVVVDYAHTPNALASVLKALRGHTTQRIFCVFGCGGDRDKGKRPLMAKIAEREADVVIVTDDNPRTEQPKAIVHDIMQGFMKTDNVVIEHDRAKAIRYAIQHAQSGDVVLIAGKGHEQVQLFANRTEVFDDRQHARQVLRELAI